MFKKPGDSVLEVLQTADDEILASQEGELRFSVRVFNPGVMKVPFRVGFICAVGYTLVSVETRDTDKSLGKSAITNDYSAMSARLDAERELCLVDKDFVVWSGQSERFHLAFRRDRPFKPGEVLAFTVRLMLNDGHHVIDAPLSFTFN